MRQKGLFVHLVILIATLIFVGGCASFGRFGHTRPNYHIDIDSIAAKNQNFEKRCIIAPGMKDVKSGDLLFQEFSTYVKRALSRKGYAIVDKPEEANIVIFLAYGISDPIERQEIYSIPIWGQTGYSSANTFGTVNKFGNTATYSGTTTYTPQYGITGSVGGTRTRIHFNRKIILNAFDFDAHRKSNKEIELWKTTISSSGSSGDFREIFPIMMAGALEYISENTRGIEEVSIYENDEDVNFILGNEPSTVPGK